MNIIQNMSDVLIEHEFKGLTPLECLLTILRENKKHEEQEATCLKKST